MKKLLLLTVALMFSLFGAMAQEEPHGKLNVFFDYFERPSSVSFVWAEAIRNNVMEGIQKTNRVNLIDVDSKSALAIEKSRREQDNVAAGEDLDRLKVMTQEGANLLVKGIVTDVTVYPVKDKNDKQIGYEANATFSLKVIDPSNGTTVLTENYKLPNNIFRSLVRTATSAAASKDEAVQDVAKSVPKEMRRFVEKAFPTEGKIIELDEVKKGDDVKTAYINLGAENGMAKGAKFEVRVKRLVGDKIAFKYIGMAEVIDVEGDDLSRVKIKKGGKLIGEAFKAGQELVIKSSAN